MIESIFFHPVIWIMPIIMLIGIALIVLDIIFEWEAIGVIIGSIILLASAGIYFIGVLPPYDVSYYQTYRITGELTEIKSAFSGDEGTMSQVFVARVDGIDLLIRSDDQRFRMLEPGDDVNLVCGKGFAYFQESWYDCSIGTMN